MVVNPDPSPTPPAEVDLTVAEVRALLAEQFPDLAQLPLTFLTSGWDNMLFRLGAEYVVRLPRRELAAALVHNEQRWLPDLANQLPIPIAAPLRFGLPSQGYPWSWSVTPFVEGEDLAHASRGQDPESSFVDPDHELERFGQFVTALHVEAPADAPINPYRGTSLPERDRITGPVIAALDSTFDVVAIRETWNLAVAAEPWSQPPVWLHGDLHLGNVIVENGRLVAIIDFGDLTAGDPATDLAAAWMMFGPDRRTQLRKMLDHDDETWTRARGWALAFALMLVRGSADNPVYYDMGDRLLHAVLAAPVSRK